MDNHAVAVYKTSTVKYKNKIIKYLTAKFTFKDQILKTWHLVYVFNFSNINYC